MLSTTEVAERLGVTRATVRNWCERGLLPGAQRIGEGPRATWAIPESALEGFERPRRGRQKQR